MFSIVTISDSRSSGSASDESGQVLKELVLGAGFQVFDHAVVPDNEEEIKNVLIKYTEGPYAVDCVITTGGTGMCPRDVTPDVMKCLIHRETTGITVALLVGSLNITPMAMTSRLISGIRNQTLMICFPGSPKACRECFAIVSPALNHCLNQVRGDLKKVSADHQHSCSNENSPGPIDPRHGVAFRPRESTFEMIEVQEALNIIARNLAKTNVVEEKSILDIDNLLGKVLSADIISSVNIPPFPASIKDGYAVIASDGLGPRKVISTASTAGINPNKIKVTPGFCVRISTGAPIPEGADSVIQVEDTMLLEANSEGEEIVIEIMVKPELGHDIRPIGCDVQKGECVLRSGCVLNPSQLGVLASIGIQKVSVVKAPVVGVLSTGDELIEAGSIEQDGKIWDSNKTLLKSLLVKSNLQYIDFGIARDDYSETREKLEAALNSDIQILITTGGVSMGEKDLIKLVLEKEFIAKIHFGRVNMKPGKPTTFFTCDWNGSKKLIFGLPGNPVSTHVTFTLFVLPTIRALSGMEFKLTGPMKAKLDTSQPLRLDVRPEFARGILSRNGLETLVRLVAGNQRSSRLMSTSGADVLIMLPSSSYRKDLLEKGEIVDVVPFI